jgi:adenylate kinase
LFRLFFYGEKQMSLYLILMGVQGAGKGVQAGIISEAYNIPHVSTGDMFRAMKSRSDDLAKQVQNILAQGLLVDDETTNAVVADRLSQPDAANGVILDGYPRNEAQAAYLDKLLAEKGGKVNAVLLLDLDLYEAFKRAFGRVTAADGESYNFYSKQDNVEFRFEANPDSKFPPRLVATQNGEELKRRADDGDAFAVIKRIDIYLAETMPVLKYYEAKGLVRKVDASQSIEDVTKDIKASINAVK